MDAINDKFSVDKIKAGINAFKQEATAYLDGGILIFLGNEDLTESEIKLLDFLKMLQSKTIEMAEQQITFLDIMEVTEYNVNELYDFLDSFRASYDNLVDSSKTVFVNSINNIADKIIMTDVASANSAALKMSFIVSASKIVFDNIQEYHDRIKKFIEDNNDI